MTMTTLDDLITEEQGLLVDTRAALVNLRDEIDELREKFACGETSESLKSCPDVKRLNSLYIACLDTENRLGKCRELKAGIAQNGVAYDLDAARDSIGRKLDRLRDATTTEDISG